MVVALKEETVATAAVVAVPEKVTGIVGGKS